MQKGVRKIDEPEKDQERSDVWHSLVERIPSVEEYNSVRVAAGLKAKDPQAARIGLSNTVFGVCIEAAGETVGIGRVVGDGALFFEVVDVAIVPDYQGEGLGEIIMNSLMDRVRASARSGTFVSLIAGEGVSDFYKRYGFRVRTPEAPGMLLTI